MRIFIAINFPEDVIESLKTEQAKLRDYIAAGNYTKRENLHLTVAFIGEVSAYKVTTIKDVLKELKTASFSLRLNGLGSFKGKRGDTFWMGVEKNDKLTEIHSFLKKRLGERGFPIDDRPYTPHLTLVREVSLHGDIKLAKEIKFPCEFDNEGIIYQSQAIDANINRISLMRSDFVEGGIRYTEVYGKELEPPNTAP